MHAEGLVHRDLKLENCFITEGMEVRLGDFGLAADVGKGGRRRRQSHCGTAHYMAPEVGREQGYGQLVDVWSLGVMTYLMMCGRFPFEHRDGKGMEAECKSGNYLRRTALS